MRPLHRLGLDRAFFLVSIPATAAIIYAVYTSLGHELAARGLYALIGLALAAAVYLGYRGRIDLDAPADPAEEDGSGTLGIKAVLSLVCLAVGLSVLVENRTYVLLAVLPAGYAVVAWRVVAGDSGASMLAQVVGLFSIPPVTKYLSTGFYFGNSDTLNHVRYVDGLLAGGEIWTMTTPRYEPFPGMHLTAGSVSLVSGLPTYDSLLVTGIVVYLCAVGLLYLLARSLVDVPAFPAVVALAVTTLVPTSFYATYFTPQSLAIALLLCFLVTCVYARESGRSAPVACAVVLGAAILFTHHLSIVLFLPFIGLIGVAAKLVGWYDARDGLSRPDPPVEPVYIPGIALGIAGVFYWAYLEMFVHNLIHFAILSLTDFASPSAGGGPIRYGVPASEETLVESVTSLASTDGVYYIVLMAVFAVGVASWLRSPRTYRSGIGAFLIGIAGALFVFPSPLGAVGYLRLGHPFGFFFAFVVGAGLLYLVAAGRRSRVAVALFVAAAVLLGTLGGVVAGDDLYGDERTDQTEFEDDELAQLQALQVFASSHTTPHEIQLTSDWWTTNTLVMQGVFENEGATQFNVTEDGIETWKDRQSILVYHDRWTEHLVLMNVFGSQRRFAMSEEWMERASRTEPKVYDSGGVSASWRTGQDVWAPESG